MRLSLDTDAKTLTLDEGGIGKVVDLYSKEAFEALSRQWVRLGWNQKYQYTFSWMGRPVIQLPEDMIRMQEVIFQVQPDVIIETGVAHGGSLIFYSSLCRAMGKGRVIGIDIEIRPHNRRAIEAHPLNDRIELVEGSSTDPGIVAQVKSLVKPGEAVLVILDSNHTYAHVHDELEAYADLVTAGSYIVATDGIMLDLADVPRGVPAWATDNPTFAARDFAAEHPEFVIEQPTWPFNESGLDQNITHWPGAWLRRR
ncbi:MAG: cephalosporin hydroxylase family protein [Geothrix sp.]|uniref:cephalosporin hydroxylase family protein n=1 Tax=Geothrix sp. TaxID=1962974 RepID=UPI0017967928|nr:CmcI family methyltransferase [Geothrix sp.]NWJ41148.1 cephalosporin hydroxylase family protein [Geothrix sp.]WIL20861.1 MAG: cephalosporin hydroxylase family protein [Geothrix sp.]